MLAFTVEWVYYAGSTGWEHNGKVIIRSCLQFVGETIWLASHKNLLNLENIVEQHPMIDYINIIPNIYLMPASPININYKQ